MNVSEIVLSAAAAEAEAEAEACASSSPREKSNAALMMWDRPAYLATIFSFLAFRDAALRARLICSRANETILFYSPELWQREAAKLILNLQQMMQLSPQQRARIVQEQEQQEQESRDGLERRRRNAINAINPFLRNHAHRERSPLDSRYWSPASLSPYDTCSRFASFIMAGDVRCFTYLSCVVRAGLDLGAWREEPMSFSGGVCDGSTHSNSSGSGGGSGGSSNRNKNESSSSSSRVQLSALHLALHQPHMVQFLLDLSQEQVEKGKTRQTPLTPQTRNSQGLTPLMAAMKSQQSSSSSSNGNTNGGIVASVRIMVSHPTCDLFATDPATGCNCLQMFVHAARWTLVRAVLEAVPSFADRLLLLSTKDPMLNQSLLHFAAAATATTNTTSATALAHQAALSWASSTTSSSNSDSNTNNNNSMMSNNAHHPNVQNDNVQLKMLVDVLCEMLTPENYFMHQQQHDGVYYNQPALISEMRNKIQTAFRDDKGDTPVHSALRSGFVDRLAPLLALCPRWANDATTDGTTTPFLLACQKCPHAVELLITHGATVPSALLNMPTSF